MRRILNGVSYHYEIYGEGDPLLLLHGFTGNVKTWEPFLSQWGKSYQFIMVDLIGHGKTDSPTDSRRYEIEKVTTDLNELLNFLQIEKVNLLGYSMGGRVALSFACQYPTMVNSLILESSSPGLKTEQERLNRIEQDYALANRIETEGLEAFVDYWENIPLFSSIKKLPTAVQDSLRRERLTQQIEGLANSLRGMGTGKQPSYWGCLSNLDIPVLLVIGSNDLKFVRIANEMEQGLTDVTKRVIDDSGHMVHLEQQKLFAEIIVKWLFQIRNT